MATPDEIRSVLDTYVERFNSGDAAGWAALFSEDATQEDPVGTPANVGREAIQGFYENMVAMLGGGLQLVVTSGPIVVGHEAVLAGHAFAGAGETRAKMPEIIDHLTFDDAGRITALRAFWSMESMEPAPE